MRLYALMSLERASRRLRHLQAVIARPGTRVSSADVHVRWSSSESGTTFVLIFFGFEDHNRCALFVIGCANCSSKGYVTFYCIIVRFSSIFSSIYW